MWDVKWLKAGDQPLPGSFTTKLATFPLGVALLAAHSSGPHAAKVPSGPSRPC